MGRMRRSAWMLARVALATAGIFLLARDASAQRRCEEDPAISGRICSLAECILLSDAVHAPEACGGASSCENITGCFNLRQMRGRWLECYIRRNRVNKRCWSNFDLGHQWAAAEAIRHVGVCDAKIRKPEPEGCADPCPE